MKDTVPTSQSDKYQHHHKQKPQVMTRRKPPFHLGRMSRCWCFLRHRVNWWESTTVTVTTTFLIRSRERRDLHLSSCVLLSGDERTNYGAGKSGAKRSCIS